ncbi:UDP-N-acetylmuramate dehydrogenase [Thiolapillus brandeum]|uniref:UDP-N-acetylenolpyruvoylglucosamine reductase n=1 Tax=Thiolapillus brandeum TaxID=1076588 RepID=A0A7U6GH15_9GAMM|nr:UDP-N-acetylmuramate dehydrogenase [Thiolapillus brandeum]BAO43505.1 UDP-N-acetylmuramate dehydrogenase [Thiolapillus brandeum]
MRSNVETAVHYTMLLMDEPMSRHTTWRVGGPARFYFQPADEADLSDFLKSLPAGEPILWLGLGSNLLVRDGGFKGTVIATRGRLDSIEVLAPNRLRVGAGAATALVARHAARAGLCGAAFLAGIPGTMGGALAMNAGAFGSETWEYVINVQTIDRQGVIHRRTPLEYKVAYREVMVPGEEWFIGCELQLEPGDTDAERERVQKLLKKRNQSQPIGQPSAGSTFRNPPGDYAARLIEEAGLKGFQMGGAQVSGKHANFIINTGTARAADVEGLIQHIQKVVEEQTGVRLQTEVHIVGDPA